MSRAADIHDEQARLLARRAAPDDQHVLRLAAPHCARAAQPGQFVHLRCDPLLPLRRPYSVMAAAPQDGWIEILFAPVGIGSRALAAKRPGATLACLGPIGRGFAPDPARRLPLLIGGGVGMPPVLFLAERLRQGGGAPTVLLGSERAFPFETVPSRLKVAGAPSAATANLRLLEERGVAGRLAAGRGAPGCFAGHAAALAARWLDARAPAERAQVQIFACGPAPMLAAVAQLAAQHGAPCQLAVEEFMACATGGCAGCAIPVRENGRDAMRRVCVDGPVFDAQAVYPELFSS